VFIVDVDKAHAHMQRLMQVANEVHQQAQRVSLGQLRNVATL
jgi:hypothetical protein